jgi:hypothetical protein
MELSFVVYNFNFSNLNFNLSERKSLYTLGLQFDTAKLLGTFTRQRLDVCLLIPNKFSGIISR